MKLTTKNLLIDIPDLNRFKIGDEVIYDATADYDRFEGVVIGVELHRTFPCCGELKPSITLLHDGYITDGFTPNDLRPVSRAALAQGGGFDQSIDMHEVAIYRGDDGQLWVRPIEEFNDGRFEILPAAPTPEAGK